MANMTFKADLLPNSDYGYRLGSITTNPPKRWIIPGTTIETIIGTQTALTGTWTGTSLTIDALYDGLTIHYFLPYPGSGNATLNLTLKDGTTTGAINCYYNESRLSTHFGRGSVITLTYFSAGSISVGGTATTDARWIANANYDSNDIGYYTRKIYPNIKAGPNKIFPYTLIMERQDGRWESLVKLAGTGSDHTANTNGFLIGNVWAMWYNETYSENNNISTYRIWSAHSGLIDMRYSMNVTSTTGFTGYKPVYLVGTIGTNGLFYLDTTKWWAQDLPSTDDGKVYIYIGDAYDYYRITLSEVKPAYFYRDSRVLMYAPGRGIKGISRNGTTFTVTRDDGSTFTFNLQDSNTTSFTITANATDGIWDLTGTNGTNAVTYAVAPYSSLQSKASFDTSSTNPSRTDRLNYNGYLYATKLYSGGNEVLTAHQSLAGYLPLSGGTMTGAIKRYYSAASTDPVLSITSNDKDVILFNIGHGTAAGTPASCWYKLIYKGTGSSPNNTLLLIAAKSTTESTAIEINEDGMITFNGTGIFKKTTDAAGTVNNSPALIIGGTATQAHIEIDANEIMAKTNGTTTATLYLNNDGGEVLIGGKVAARVTSTPTSGQIMIADGTGGLIKSSGYTIAKSVPSDAVFTDTNNAVTQTNQTNQTDSNDYRILLSGSANDTDATEGTNKSTNLRFNPSTKVFSVGGDISATGDLTITGNANLNNETYAESITAGSLLVNGAANFVNIPTAPTPEVTSNDTSIATTAFVKNNIGGLSGAMHFKGTTTTTMSDGLTTAAVTIGGSSYTPEAGDVVLYSDSEFVWTGSIWERLGRDSSFKTTQTAVTKPTATTNKWVSAIGQDANGNISVDYSTLVTTGTWNGNAATASKLGTSSVGSSIQPIYLSNGTATKGEYMLPIYYSNLDYTSTTPVPGAYTVNAQTHPVTGVAEYGSALSLPGIDSSTKHYAAQLLISSPSGQASAVHGYIRRLTNTPSWSNWSTLLDDSNYTTYTVEKDGTGATGSWGISVTGSAAKLSNTSKIGDTNKPVYFTAGGVPTAISYTINKSVPSDAVFTDTKVTSVGNHYAPSADTNAALSVDASSTTAATWGSTSLVTGVNIQRDAKGHVTGVTVDSIKMPANPNADTKVNVKTRNTTTKAYIMADATAPTATAAAHEAVAETTIYMDTTAGAVAATSYKIAEKVILLYNTATNALDFVFT